MHETTINRLQEDDFCSIFTSERKFINRLKELAQKYPNDVKIQYINNDGSIGAKVPINWFRFIKPPTKRNYTDEQRKNMGERMKRAREKKTT